MNLPVPTPTLARLNPHLFGGARAEGRGSREGACREAELHDQVFDECRRRGWIALHGSMAERTCRTLGEPDFVILADAGRVLLVECKSRSGKLSPAQVALKHHAEKLGHTAPRIQGNNRRSNRVLKCNGMSLTLSEWSEVTGIKKTTLRERIRRGWSVERALR